MKRESPAIEDEKFFFHFHCASRISRPLGHQCCRSAFIIITFLQATYFSPQMAPRMAWNGCILDFCCFDILHRTSVVFITGMELARLVTHTEGHHRSLVLGRRGAAAATSELRQRYWSLPRNELMSMCSRWSCVFILVPVVVSPLPLRQS